MDNQEILNLSKNYAQKILDNFRPSIEDTLFFAFKDFNDSNAKASNSNDLEAEYLRGYSDKARELSQSRLSLKEVENIAANHATSFMETAPSLGTMRLRISVTHQIISAIEEYISLTTKNPKPIATPMATPMACPIAFESQRWPRHGTPTVPPIPMAQQVFLNLVSRIAPNFTIGKTLLSEGEQAVKSLIYNGIPFDELRIEYIATDIKDGILTISSSFKLLYSILNRIKLLAV